MKKIYFFLVASFIWGCEKAEKEPSKELTDGFCIQVQDEVVLNHHSIDVYDASENKLYLKTANPFAEEYIQAVQFTVYADRDSIYSGALMSTYSSFLPTGPRIFVGSIFKSESTLQIGCVFIKDEFGNVNPDPRLDPRIIEALKKYNQFRE